MSIQTEIDRIISLVGDSYAKVKAKGGTATAPYLLADLPGAIESIPKGVELPKLTNPASASDIVKGKEVIGSDGNVITGEVLAVNAFNTSMNASGMSVNGTDLVMTSHQYGSFMLNAGSDIVFKTPLNLFGDATAEDVAEGVIFTSEQGFRKTGTMKRGIDTSDATATASDMAQGVTAYVNGEKVTGTVLTVSREQSIEYPNTTLYTDNANNKIVISGKAFPSTLLRQSATVKLAVSSDSFGDATAADVAAGKTFTSAAGLKVVGTAEAGGGGDVTPPTTPTDGKTRVYIHLEYGRTSPMLGVCPKGTVTVDWGDGTEPDTLTGTSTTTVKWTPTHKYTAPGDYVIAMTVKGTMGFYGNGSGNQYSGILRYASGEDTRNLAYQNAVQKVEIGEGVTSIGDSAFQNCYSFASITIPEGVTSIGSKAFRDCYSLASITIPEGVTSIGSNAFQNCYSFASITIPEGVTSISNYAFYNCHSLASITIPEGVTSIGNFAFMSCYGMRYYDFTSCTSVPALPNKNAFNNIPSDCQMLIPAALYDKWSAATNWATYASYMVAV